MKIVEIKKLTKKELPSLYCSPLVPPETEEEAVSWAEKYGVDTLYKFRQGKVWLYLVEVK